MKSSAYDTILKYMPIKLRGVMMRGNAVETGKLTEVRIRSGRPVSFTYGGTSLFMDGMGRFTHHFSENGLLTASYSDICHIVDNLAHHSMHSSTRQLRQGCFVAEGGVRVGLAGTYTDTSPSYIKEVNGINFRIAREVIGCGQRVADILVNSSKGMLICGGVNTGKTTLLRDMCRVVGNRSKVTLVDERNEISALVNGTPTNDIGCFTDVICGISRYDGIISAIRTLSPDYIFCDEIAEDMDCKAILSGVGCGIKFAATIHAENYDELLSRIVGQNLLSAGVFENVVFLGGKVGEIWEVRHI